jgi:hypothetical protein
MKALEIRLNRLEDKLGLKPSLYHHIVITNVPPEDAVESPYLVKISSELWAEAIGGSFTTEQINELRKQYADR